MEKLKTFLLEKGENIDNLNNNQILQRVKQIRNGQVLNKIENEICSYCSNKFDNCICNKCRECYEIICECSYNIDDIKIITEKDIKENELKEKIKKEKEKQEKEQEKLMKKQIKEREKKLKEKEKKLKKEKKIKEKEIEKQKNRQIKRQEKDESLLLISLYSYKIKLKIFLLEKIIPHPKLYPDIIELLNLILLKNNIELKNEEKENLNTIFNRIYNEDIKKQKNILKCIIDNLVK